MQIAIVTGASSGLGRLYVYALNQEGLDEIWVIARREKKLQDLAEKIETPLRLLPLDLASIDSIEAIRQELSCTRPIVKYLVNAAGIGYTGSTSEMHLQELCSLIDLNCRAAAAIVQVALPHIPPTGKILNICSCAAFHPIPYLNVYSATKSFLLSYSQALHEELLPQGIHVTAVCPYWISNTEFIEKIIQGSAPSGFTRFPFAQEAEDIVLRSLRGAKNNIAVVTPSLLASLHHLLSCLLPHELLMFFSNLIHKK